MKQSLIIIPTYNEADNVLRIIPEVLEQHEGFHVLIVDDNSPDGTAQLVKEMQNKDTRIHLIERPGKQGLGTAYVAGFKYALTHGFDFIFEMDADFSHDPKSLIKLLSRAEEYDLVIGSRYISGVNVINWPMSRLILSYTANLYTRIITGLPVRDATAGFKCYRRVVLENIDLDSIHSNGYSFQIETNFKAWKRGFRLSEVPIVFVDRRAGTSKMSKHIVYEAAWMVWKLKIHSLFAKNIVKRMAGSKKYALLEISVIIVNYNVRDFLLQSLVSLQKALKGIRSEILVVDNASDDGSAELIRHRFPRVRLFPQQHNLGFAKANNIALQHVRGKYVLLINPDTVVQEDTIRVMINFMHAHQDVGLSGCKILNPDGSFQLPCRRSFPTPWVAFTKIFGLSYLFSKTKLFGKYNLTYLPTEETYPVDAVSGSFMFVRKATIDQVGGLDESFFMYGEDLDWCYRIRQAGWQVAYVPMTQIIHYKGESTRRSSLDEINTFYRAMHLFVEKHFNSSFLYAWFLRTSISLVSFVAFFSSVLRPLKVAIFDFLSVTLCLLLAEVLWRGTFFQYPVYAYPIVFTLPAIIVIGCLYAAGVYTQRRMSVSRSIVATFVAFVFISALTAFFKSYAFSRMIVGISGILSIILIPGWRLFLRLLGKTSAHGRGTLFGKRTLIVGTNNNARALQKRLRSRVGEGYEVVGFVGTTHKDIGEIMDGISVIGSIENVGKIIKDKRVSDVIFAPQVLSYSQILSVISRSREQAVGFHLVPSTMDVIVGKASVDSLDDLPLVQIAYNIDKPFHILTKRIFDLVISGLLLMTVYPIFRLFSSRSTMKSVSFFSRLPEVFRGTKSFVGPPPNEKGRLHDGNGFLFLGKSGLSGLVQLQHHRTLSQDEIDQYNLYYARNQSVLLDLEILIKTWLQFRNRNKSRKNQ